MLRRCPDKHTNETKAALKNPNQGVWGGPWLFVPTFSIGYRCPLLWIMKGVLEVTMTKIEIRGYWEN
jgi:hypothetical protein